MEPLALFSYQICGRTCSRPHGFQRPSHAVPINSPVLRRPLQLIAPQLRVNSALRTTRCKLVQARALRVEAALSPRESEATAALEKGKALYATGERMAALNTFEAALKKFEANADVSDVRMELLYSAACCHAAFGDIEMAWQNLRDSLEMGLDYSTVSSNPQLLQMEASAQMRKQLLKYSEGRIKSTGTVAKEAFERSRSDARQTAPKNYSGKTESFALKDLEIDGNTGDSFLAIGLRVLGLLAASAIVGGVLFYSGLNAFF